jgi:hypothetical protein
MKDQKIPARLNVNFYHKFPILLDVNSNRRRIFLLFNSRNKYKSQLHPYVEKKSSKGGNDYSLLFLTRRFE